MNREEIAEALRPVAEAASEIDETGCNPPDNADAYPNFKVGDLRRARRVLDALLAEPEQGKPKRYFLGDSGEGSFSVVSYLPDGSHEEIWSGTLDDVPVSGDLICFAGETYKVVDKFIFIDRDLPKQIGRRINVKIIEAEEETKAAPPSAPAPMEITFEAIEARARRIAAAKCGVKDATGASLPDDIWKQAAPQAARELQVESDQQATLASAYRAGLEAALGVADSHCTGNDDEYDDFDSGKVCAAREIKRAILALQPPPDLAKALDRRLAEERQPLLALIKRFLLCPEIADCAPEDLDNETRELERDARRALGDASGKKE